MKKTISHIFTLTLFFITFSCTSYIKPIHTESVSGSENITRKLVFQDGTLDVNFYGDYLFDKVDKNLIFFTNKEISGMLSNLTIKPSSQILFPLLARASRSCPSIKINHCFLQWFYYFSLK